MNDDHVTPNCTMRKIVVMDEPHLFLFAVKDIIPGEELRYNYGPGSYPWRTKVCSIYIYICTTQINDNNVYDYRGPHRDRIRGYEIMKCDTPFPSRANACNVSLLLP